MRTDRKSNGFTLIELLIVVAIVGIVAAIAIPNLLNALDRSKQKRTMADLRSVGSAIEQYSIDQTNYPIVNTLANLEAVLEPIYIDEMAEEDAWGNALIVDSIAWEYTLASPGKDGGAINVIGGATTNFNDAIIFANGQFFQWPEGGQN